MFFSLFASESMATNATNTSFGPGVSLDDKLRLAASKGQIEKVKELIGAGASFEGDRVRKLETSKHNLLCTFFTT